jgi:hypothetical protein
MPHTYSPLHIVPPSPFIVVITNGMRKEMQENAQPAQEASPILLERSSYLLIDSDRYPLHNQVSPNNLLRCRRCTTACG